MCQYAVVDLEMCRIPKRLQTSEYHWSQETIQIGAVLLNDSYEITDSFSTYVCPQFGIIDPFIEKMTRISDQKVKGAPFMKDALKLFSDWLPQDTRFVEWSDSDHTQIRHEITGKSIFFDGIEHFEEPWIDCQAMFTAKLSAERAYSLAEALNLSNISYKDGAHDGWVDAYNTALLFAKLRQTPDYEINEYYLSRPEHLSFSIGDMIAGLRLSPAS
ncbi:MAG: exonuclease domain-containing protein [Lachnospiraceae bacterium]|nr:exonuclease domain-containing protein [Lachnospiraceae bacterium]